MVRLKYDLNKIPSYKYSYMYCKNCGEMEVEPGINHCINCGSELIRSSVYEWNLVHALERELEKLKIKHRVVEQFPVMTPNRSLYHWDIFVWVNGKLSNCGCGYLIEVNGSEHYTEYGREKDIKKQRYALPLLRPGMAFRIVKNEECTVSNVQETAKKIVKELIDRTNCG